MNWQPPTPTAPGLTPPSGAPRPSRPDDSPEPPEESADQRRANSAASAAAWVGLLGAALVLIAAGVVLTNSWPSYGKVIRLIVLAMGSAAATLVAERFRRAVPVSATIDAHVGAFLVGATGVAATSLIGYTWPLCLTVGGAAAAASTQVQSRRWRPDTMLAGQVVAVVVAAIGAGALTPFTAGLLMVAAAAVFELLGAHRRAAVVAGLAVLSPAVRIVGLAGFGPGTLDRAGLTGERLDWSRPLVGLLAGVVFAVVAYRTGRHRLYLAAVIAPLWSGADRLVDLLGRLGGWLDRYDVTTTDRAMLALSLLAVALGAVFRRAAATSSWVADTPALVLSGMWLVGTVAGRNPGWAIPLALTVGIVAAALGAWFRLGAPLVGGTTITGLTVLVASWSELAGTPTWVWLALGGATLLSVAVMIERRGVPHAADLRSLTNRWG